MCILGACLCISGWTGLLWLSWHHTLSAAPSFLRLWALVGCCELHFLAQKQPNKAETFAREHVNDTVSASLGCACVLLCKHAATRNKAHHGELCSVQRKNGRLPFRRPTRAKQWDASEVSAKWCGTDHEMSSFGLHLRLEQASGNGNEAPPL